ncbi:MAG: 4-alpha-glucanotransferase [Nitrospira sp.]|nr:4-alpha-glucanotransferase [Nitrospira sp.]MDH4370025.1 4-alpha-glucanotransferase [Nitrospira sp.]MDH5498804.1 4-alpha-glucanotransferase [Nitrospira sp.]
MPRTRRRKNEESGIAVSDGRLRQLAARYGVVPAYVDEGGVRRLVHDESLRRVLSVMGVDAQNSTQLTERMREVRSGPWREMLDPAMVVRVDRLPRTCPVRLPVAVDQLRQITLVWRLTKEQGGVLTGRSVGRRLQVRARTILDGLRHCEVALPFPRALPLGYHSLTVDASGPRISQRAAMTVVVVPSQCYLHPAVMDSRRTWGITIQLYGLRSVKNWGVGDFRDLKEMIHWAGSELGADLLGVNPLHALPPGQVSPYSPSSRLFHHSLYLDLEGIQEFRDASSVQEKVKAPAFQAKLASLRRSPTVQYEAVERVKRLMLEELFRLFQRHHLARKTARARAFHRFVRSQGEALQRFALFRTLEEQMARRGKVVGTGSQGWRSWPLEYRHPDSPSVKQAAIRHQDRLQFFQYVEWQCQQQLQAVQSAANRSGMAIGLYKDMAVGIDPGGADSWAFQDQLVAAASVGTPPELFSPNGQRWNLSPFHPRRIRKDGYRLFADCYRRTMRACGLIRIDHAMGLFRLFWIPDGLVSAQGTYVRYPAEDLLGILALESQRERVMVIGEDLGTVTPSIRTQLMAGGLLSYRLLLFEQTARGRFVKPSRFPTAAAASVTTHDLPTLRGFWIGRDIELKSRLGLYRDSEWLRRDMVTRARDKQALLDALSEEGLLPAGASREADTIPQLTDELCRAVYAYVARTPSRLVLISLEDLLGDIETPNVPGEHAYPSWRIKAGPPGTTWEDWTKLVQVPMMAQTISSQRNRG